MLETLLIIFCCTLTFGFFVYFLSGLDSISRKFNPEPNIKPGHDREDPSRVFNSKWNSPGPRPRICPICGTYLTKNDYLYAAMGPEPGEQSLRKRQVKIYGCPYCYPEKKSGLQKTTL